MPVSVDLKNKITDILKQSFPDETVDVSDGYQDNIHIVVVSHKFTNLSEKEKQDMLWDIIDKSDLADSEKIDISLILPYSPKELK